MVWAEGSAREPIAEAPLSKRGWVLQEQILAPRTVHFTKQRIFLECLQLYVTETDPYCDFQKPTDAGLGRGWIIPPTKLEPRDIASRESKACLEKWKNAIELYSETKLTYESDKLVAIAGIARYLHSLWPDPTNKYVAGLWSYGLLHSVLWHRVGPPTSSSRPDQYRTPSWFWTAVNGEIEFDRVIYDGYCHQYLAVVQQQKTGPVSDPFGAVSCGYICIKGPSVHSAQQSSKPYPALHPV